MESPTLVGGLHCPDCNGVSPAPTNDEFERYFVGEKWRCPHCRHEEVLWDKLLGAMLEDNPLVPGVIALGFAYATLVSFGMSKGVILPVHLEQAGIPADATLLDVFLTPQSVGDSGLFPALSLQRLQRQELPRSFAIHPVAWADEPDASEGVVHIMAVWAPASSEPEMAPLVTAAQSFVNGDYRGVIVPANVAVESKLYQVLAAHFSQFAGIDHVRSFLTDGATYGYQLRFLWPSVFSSAGAPDMKSLPGELQRLRRLRNKVSHEHGDVDREDAARLLLAATFGYRYLSVYGHLIGP